MYRLERVEALDVSGRVNDASGNYNVRGLGNWENGAVLYNGGSIGDPAVVVKDMRLAEELLEFLNRKK